MIPASKKGIFRRRVKPCNQAGAALVEYVIFGSFFLIAAIGAVSKLGDHLRPLFATASDSLAGSEDGMPDFSGASSGDSSGASGRELGESGSALSGNPSDSSGGTDHSAAIQRNIEQTSGSARWDFEPPRRSQRRSGSDRGWKMRKTGWQDTLAEGMWMFNFQAQRALEDLERQRAYERRKVKEKKKKDREQGTVRYHAYDPMNNSI